MTRHLIHTVILLLIGLMPVVLCYPGLLSPDGLFQLVEVKSGIINNLHPPIMAYVWRLLPLDQHGGIYLFHSLLCVAGATLCALGITRVELARLMIVMGLVFTPPLLAILITVWKDAGVLGSGLCAVGCLLCYLRAPRWGWWLVPAALVALWYMAALRHNALLGVIPFLWWISCQRHAHLIYHLLLTLLLVLCFAISVNWVNERGVYSIKLWPTVAVWDLAAMSIEKQTMLLPPSVLARPELNVADISRLFIPESNVSTCQYEPDHGRMVHCLQPLPLRAGGGIDTLALPSLWQHWLATIRAHPEAYLRHRLRLSCFLVGLCQSANHIGFNTGTASISLLRGEWYDGPAPQLLKLSDPNPLAAKERQALIHLLMDLKKNTALLDGWPYLLCLLALLPAALRIYRRTPPARRSLLMAVMISGWLMALPLLFIAPSLHLRYLVWPIACSLVGWAMWLRQWRG